MRVVMIGDVGGLDGYHLGDEAMLDVAIGELSRRGAQELTVISSNPIDTATRYGVTGLSRIGFSDRSVRSDGVRDRQLDAVVALAESGRFASTGTGVLAEDEGARERAEAVIEAVGAADAVVVAGGGNLSSSWPEHLYERTALLSIAHRAGVAAVVTSQTLGPSLSDRQAVLLGAALSTARVIGLRERPSYDLAASLVDDSTPRRLQLDDAVAIPDDAVPTFDGDRHLADGYIALSFSPIVDDRDNGYFDSVAALARRLHERSGLPLAFVPNVGSWSAEPTDDVAVGQELRRRLGSGAHLVLAPLLPARQAAALLRGASAILSTRYHPVVLGLGATVPCLAFAQDRYTAVKLRGAMTPAGLAGWCVPIEIMASEFANDLVDEFWDRREELVEHLAATTAPWPSMHRAHWDELWQALTTDAALPIVRGSVEAPTITVAPKVAGLDAVHAVSVALRDRVAATERQWEEAFAVVETYALSLEDSLAAKAHDLTAVQDRLTDLEADNMELVSEAQASVQAARSARALVAEMGAHFDERAWDRTRVSVALDDASDRIAVLQAHLDALYSTRILRWARPLRSAWGWLRNPRSRGASPTQGEQ